MFDFIWDDEVLHGKAGQNYAIIFSVWDWIFGTIYYPDDVESPQKLGFKDFEKFPKSIIKRFIYPFIK